MMLDTSGLLCLHHEEEPGHEDAVEMFEAAGTKFVHSYILSEFVALAHARGLNRTSTLGFLDGLEAQIDVRVVWVDEALHRQAIAMLARQPDKSYSLCDAVSFLLMRRFGMTEALTTDHHFEQAGFVRVLRP